MLVDVNTNTLVGFYVCVEEDCNMTFTISDRTKISELAYNSFCQVVCPRCRGTVEKVL